MGLRVPLGIGVWLACLAGCGGNGDNSQNNCSNIMPCGGNVVGTWQISGSCVDPGGMVSLESACPNAGVTGGSRTASGTITFNADSTYTSSSESSTETLSLRIPLSCLASSGPSCEAAGQSISAASVDAGYRETLSCTTSGSNCDCTLTDPVPAGGGSATYLVSGSTLAFTQGSTWLSSGGYCVQGNTLHILSVFTPTGVGTFGAGEVQVEVKSDLVLTRQ